MPEIDEDALGPVSDYEPFPPLAAPGGASTPADAIEGYAGIVMGGNPPGFGMLGKTVATANGLMPPRFDINVEEIDGQFVARIKPTTTHDALHEAVATTPGFFEDRPVEAEILKKGGPGYRYYLEVTEAMSALVFQGEQEHLDDCLLAYERVCLAAGDAINVIAAKPEGFSAATAEEAKSNLDAALLEALPAELRRLPRDIGKYGNFVQDVFGKTMVYRDKRGLHSMTRKFQFKSKKTKELISEAIPSSTVSIGQVSSDTVVTDAIATAEII